MVRGLYTAALGMTVQMQKMDVVSNNIANVNTTGFKKDNTIMRSFSEELMSRLDTPGERRHSTQIGKVSLGVFVDDVYTDFTNGSLRNTEGPLDLAISGGGFFAINVTGRDGTVTEMYTRDGSFTLASDGSLLTKEGNRVMGREGALNIPQGSISVNENGDVYSNGEYIDTLKTVNFTDAHTMRKYRDNLYQTTEDSVQAAFTGRIEQGFLENSNVNSVREMVDMITVNRAYEANQRVITAIDTTMSRSVNDIGRK